MLTNSAPVWGTQPNIGAESSALIDANGINRLLLAIVIQAIDDYRKQPGDLWLKAWLLKDGLFILETCNQPIHPDEWARLVQAGFPGKFSITRR